MPESAAVDASLKTAARWAVLLPFFVLPVSLTIDAPDVHGGYGIHLRQALLLAVIGGVAALMVGAWRRLEARTTTRPRVRRAMEIVLLLPILVGVGHLLTTVGAGYGPKQGTRALVVLAVVVIGAQVRTAVQLRNAVIAGALLAGAVAGGKALSMGEAASTWWVPELPAAIAAIVLGVGFRWVGGGDSETLRWLEQGPVALGEKLVLAAAAAAFGVAGASFLSASAGALAAALGFDAPAPFGRDLWIVTPWTLFVVAVLLRPVDGPAVGALAGIGATAILGAAVGIRPIWIVFVAIILLPSLANLAGGERWRLGVQALGAVLGLPAGHYIVAAWPGDFGDVLPLVAGGALGISLATTIATRWERAESVPDPFAVGSRLALLAIAPILLLDVAVAWGLAHALTAVCVVAATGAALSPRVPARYPLWALFYASFAIITVFRLGPSSDDCATVEATALHLRAPGEAEPYDVLPMGGGVLASFKRIDRRGGYLELFGETTTRFETKRADGGPLWPERLERDPDTGRAWVQILGFGNYAMWELAVDGSPPRPVVVRRLPIAYEPGNPAVHDGRLLLSYVPNRQPTNPTAEAFDLDTLQSVAAASGSGLRMSDFITVDPASGHAFLGLFHGGLRFALIELDRELKEVRREETFAPAIGLAADGDLLWVTNPLAGTVEVRRGLELVQTVDAGAFPRDLVLDRDRDLLHVAAYSSGDVHTYWIDEDGRLSEVRRARVGSLLRGIGLDAATGALYAASGCGVFEVAYSGSIEH